MSAWHTTPAPKDGTVIVAVGRVIGCEPDDSGGSVTAFSGAVRWQEIARTKNGGHWFWADESDGLVVARDTRDQVVIDWWLPHPVKHYWGAQG